MRALKNKIKALPCASAVKAREMTYEMITKGSIMQGVFTHRCEHDCTCVNAWPCTQESDRKGEKW